MNSQMMGQQGQGQEQKVAINLGDLSTVLQLIDVVSTRGGFQGNELAGIGMLRNKIEAFLRQNVPQQDLPAGQSEVDVAMTAQDSLTDKVVG